MHSPIVGDHDPGRVDKRIFVLMPSIERTRYDERVSVALVRVQVDESGVVDTSRSMSTMSLPTRTPIVVMGAPDYLVPDLEIPSQ